MTMKVAMAAGKGIWGKTTHCSGLPGCSQLVHQTRGMGILPAPRRESPSLPLEAGTYVLIPHAQEFAILTRIPHKPGGGRHKSRYQVPERVMCQDNGKGDKIHTGSPESCPGQPWTQKAAMTRIGGVSVGLV